MKAKLSLLVFVGAAAFGAQAQTLPPAPVTPEMQELRAKEARGTYEAQKEQTSASEQASRDTRSAMHDSKEQMREQKKHLAEQKDQLKAQRRTEKENEAREKLARTQMKEEKKRAKAMH
jgi:hypothetical protein